MKKHFVTFFSPGTFVAEETTKEINSWDVQKAIDMSGTILERYNTLPYGFQFSTRERGENDFDSKETSRSPMYYLGGEILTIDAVRNQRNPDNDILIFNMECNHWDRVIVNTNSYRWVQPLRDGDIVLK